MFELFSQEFMLLALAGAGCAALACGVVGPHLLQRRLAYAGDALAHAVLPGLVMAHLIGWHPLWGALAAAMVLVVVVAWAGRHRHTGEDAAIGIGAVGLFALGVVLQQRLGNVRDLHSLLVGNLIGVSPNDLMISVPVAVTCAVVVIAARRPLELAGSDPAYARSLRLDPERLRVLLLMATALAVVAAIRSVGVILATALLLAPAATARLLARRMLVVQVLAVGIGCLGAVVGLLLSWHLDLAAGATVALVLCATFVVVRIARG